MSKGVLDTTDPLAMLRDVANQRNLENKLRQSWKILTRISTEHELTPALDFAVQKKLVGENDATRIRLQHTARLQRTFWTNPIDDSQMAWIPAGAYFVGKDRQRVDGEGFSLARHPITNRQFQRFLQATGYRPSSDHPDPALFLSHWTHGIPLKGVLDHPVTWISFLDALHYCRWAGLILPSEWQWEKAARGFDGRTYPWGEQNPLISNRGKRRQPLARLNTNALCPIGSYPTVRSPFGCEEMIGNVSQWCQMIGDEPDGRSPIEWPEIHPAAQEVSWPRTLVAVRGACYLRSSGPTFTAWHRRRLSATRRNQWVGLRPAFFTVRRPR